jgi:quercetin dioxygenase-like cupin family protein
MRKFTTRRSNAKCNQSMNKIVILIIGLLVSLPLYAANCLECTFDLAKLQSRYHGTEDAKVNGRIPPEPLGGKSVFLLEREFNRILYRTERVDRNPGFRSSVHYHLFPVTTCVIQGTTTLELEGYQNHEYTQGQCFLMPAYVKGCNVNRGKTPVVLYDYVASAPKTPWMVPIETKK